MPEPTEREIEIFNAALKFPPGQRAAYLDEACASDPALRQSVAELLQAIEGAGNFLDGLGAVSPGPGGLLRLGIPPVQKPGDRVGRYKLLQQIGEGGCGVVYMAEQEEPVRRKVALKVIKLGMDTKEVIARFEAERQALALMEHPNIAKVLDAGATETGRPYFVMELVRGIKITDYCDENNLSTVVRLELFSQVCQAIQHAHQKGIIHRDIKPSNILVADYDGKPVPKIIDFGIAKATTDQRLTDKTLFTAFEQFIGTPAYMSPEQARLSGLDVDTRSDIYSLGVLLYELLTGQTPFDTKKLLQAGLDEIRRTIREEEPSRPSTCLSTLRAEDLSAIARQRQADPPKLIHLVRGDLDWIVMKALEKDRTRRYETANGLAADIQRHLNNEAVLARPPSGAYKFQKLVRRNKLVFAAGGAIVAALAVGVVLSVWALVKERQARWEAQQVSQFLENMLNSVGPSVALGRDTALLKEVLDNTAKRAGTDLAKQPEVEAELRYTLGEVYWELGDLADAEAMHRAALSIRTNVLGPKNPLVAQSMRRLAHVLWRQGHLDRAEKMARASVDMQRELLGTMNLEVARSLEDLAAIFNTKGAKTKAEEALREALAIKAALLGRDNLEVADTIDDLGSWLLSQHYKVPEAEALLEEAVAIRRKILGADNPLVIIASLKTRVTELDLQGQSSEEEAALKELVAAKRRLFGNEHPDLAQSLNQLASVLKNEDKLAESEPVRREALSMQCKLLGRESAEAAQTMCNLGELLTEESKLDEAETMLRDSLMIRVKVLGLNSTLAANSLTDLGEVLEKEGKFEETKNLYHNFARGSLICAAAARYRLGLMYLRGRGVQQDAAEAAKWYRKSADAGYSRAQIDLAVLYLNGTGVPQDENKAVAWFRKAAALGNVVAMKSLANSYCAVGRSRDAMDVLAKFCGDHPSDTDASLTLASWQAWFGFESEYESTRRRLTQQAAETDQPLAEESAAKAACLRPSADPVLLQQALEFARAGAQWRQGTPWSAWYQLSLGLAEYRNGQYANAEQTLLDAEQTVGKFHDILGTSRFFRAMSLFRQGRTEEAQKLFVQAEAQMPAFPQDENRPILDGNTAPHDVIICWLAYREAKSLLK